MDHPTGGEGTRDSGRLYDASEFEVRALLEYAPIGIALVRDRKVVRVNEAICALFGYTREELVGSSTRIVYANDDEFERVGRELREMANRPKDAASAPVAFIARHKKGHAIDAIIQLTFLDPANPQAGAVCMVTDITEHT